MEYIIIDSYIMYIILILISNISFVIITVITNTGILPLYTHTYSNNKVKKNTVNQVKTISY